MIKGVIRGLGAVAVVKVYIIISGCWHYNIGRPYCARPLAVHFRRVCCGTVRRYSRVLPPDGFLSVQGPQAPYVRLRAPGFLPTPVTQLPRRPDQLTERCLDPSQHPFTIFSSHLSLQRLTKLFAESEAIHALPLIRQPVMYRPNSHQTDICLELLLTARVTFR